MAEGPRLTILGRIFILLFIAGCGYGAYLLFTANRGGRETKTAQTNADEKPSVGGVEIGIAYGTEKQRWLEWAVEEFTKTREGKRTQINLIPMGSLEGAQAVLSGDKQINVWSPASSLYTDVFRQEWQLKYNRNPILRQEPLALTPMVFVFWKERYDAFIQKFPEVSFRSIQEALSDAGGWQGIAGKGEWGIFKFGHTRPNQSNSGIASLYLMLAEFSNKSRDISLKDVVDQSFTVWMNALESGVSGLSNSTGNMMRDMVLRGPSSYDALFVYENVAIDYLKSAHGRWGELYVTYPKS
jgi:Ca-activated chloride channel family protein